MKGKERKQNEKYTRMGRKKKKINECMNESLWTSLPYAKRCPASFFNAQFKANVVLFGDVRRFICRHLWSDDDNYGNDTNMV